MKKSLSLLGLLFLFLFSFQKSHATHYMGGEITWECLSNGNYRFILKAYRECYTTNGYPAANYGQTQTLHSDSPIGSILLTEIPGWPKDISPVCNANSNFLHITCVGMDSANGNANIGAVEEHIYTTDSLYPNGIHINGVPPASGWTFYWQSCCRNPSSNVVGQPSWRLRAKMYPYGNQNAYPCYDNCPVFAEKPRTVIPTGYFSYDNLAFDPDLDSLAYEWGQPLLSTGSPLSPYVSGYSYQNPLPDTSQNPANVPAVMNPTTGMVTLTSYTSGAFVTSIKVTSYRAGIKISEIWRDIQVVITANGINASPQITPPFDYGTSFTKTVFAGDTVEFGISGTDFGFLPNGTPQSLNLKCFGQQFGEYIPPTNYSYSTLSSTTGCITPPCATLTPAPDPSNPLISTFSVQTQFKWVTSCAHLNPSIGANQGSNIYRFLVTLQDDFCPVPAVTSKIITIKVIDRPPLGATAFDSISFDYGSLDATLNWQKSTDPYNQFDAYYIYYSTSPNGPFSLVDSVMDINTTQAVIHTGKITKAYFYLKIKSHTLCANDVLSAPSAVYSLDLTAIEDIVKKDGFYLLQNRPNPASQSTVVEFIMNVPEPAEFQLVTIDGKVIERREIQSTAGLNKINIDLSSLKAGVYYYSLQVGGITKSAKMIVIKK